MRGIITRYWRVSLAHEILICFHKTQDKFFLWCDHESVWDVILLDFINKLLSELVLLLNERWSFLNA